jgi:hypothetical protein
MPHAARLPSSVVTAGALVLKLRAIDKLPSSTPRRQHHELDLNATGRSDTTMQTDADTDALDDLQVLVKHHLRRPELITNTWVELSTVVQ